MEHSLVFAIEMHALRMRKSVIWSKERSQVSSHVVDAIALYLALAEEQETLGYFFVRQEMGLVSSWTKKLVVEQEVVGQLARRSLNRWRLAKCSQWDKRGLD